MDKVIRVLVVDDSTFMRGALVRMIEKNPRFKVIDVASNGREGVDKALALRPDVVTMDVEMPVMSGIEALKEIMQRARMPVVMVSTLTESGAATTLQALELGAVDFIPKALQDKDKNIFRGAEVIHEKLAAAAGARVAMAGPAQTPVMAAPATAPVVRTLAPGVERVNARMMVVGSSTGGPRALQDFFRDLPAHLPVPVLVAQHMPPAFTEALAQRLDETCPPTVVQAKDGDVPQAGTIYIAPGGLHMRLGQDGKLNVREEAGESPYRPSVDVLAESVAQVLGKQVLGVMLTGMGNDGARAFLGMRQLGAHVIAQDAGTSVVYGMPKAAAENGAANDILPIQEIAGRVCRLLGC